MCRNGAKRDGASVSMFSDIELTKVQNYWCKPIKRTSKRMSFFVGIISSLLVGLKKSLMQYELPQFVRTAQKSLNVGNI